MGEEKLRKGGALNYNILYVVFSHQSRPFFYDFCARYLIGQYKAMA